MASIKKNRVRHPKHLNVDELSAFEKAFNLNESEAITYIFCNYNMSIAQSIAFVRDYKTWKQ